MRPQAAPAGRGLGRPRAERGEAWWRFDAQVFDPPLEEVAAAVLAVFDSICGAVTGLPELRHAILHVGPDVFLTTVQVPAPAGPLLSPVFPLSPLCSL